MGITEPPISLKKDDIAAFHQRISAPCSVVRSDIEGSLKLFMQESGNPEVVRILGSSDFSHRIKDPDAIFRKCLRDKVSRIEDIQEKIEDLIGLRIITLNKKDARNLFDYLKARAADWFCEKANTPNFVSYTWESTNRYSMKSGY